jgi:hypothetical protein
MSEKAKVRVVKKADARSVKKARKVVKPVSSREAAREMVSTVTEWISEVKERKSDETRAALELLFRGAQPN